LQISPYPLKGGARFHIRAHLSLKGEVGVDLPTLKQPVLAVFSAHLPLKSRFPDPFSYSDLFKGSSYGAILGAQHRLYSLKSRFSTPFSYRSAKNGRRADA